MLRQYSWLSRLPVIFLFSSAAVDSSLHKYIQVFQYIRGKLILVFHFQVAKYKNSLQRKWVKRSWLIPMVLEMLLLEVCYTEELKGYRRRGDIESKREVPISSQNILFQCFTKSITVTNTVNLLTKRAIGRNSCGTLFTAGLG